MTTPLLCGREVFIHAFRVEHHGNRGVLLRVNVVRK